MITVTVKLGSALAGYHPEGSGRPPFEYRLEIGSTVADLISRLGIPTDQSLLVIIDGDIVRTEDYPTHALQNGQSISLMPPIQAG